MYPSGGREGGEGVPTSQRAEPGMAAPAISGAGMLLCLALHVLPHESQRNSAIFAGHDDNAWVHVNVVSWNPSVLCVVCMYACLRHLQGVAALS